jgi:hypothetical protein
MIRGADDEADARNERPSEPGLRACGRFYRFRKVTVVDGWNLSDEIVEVSRPVAEAIIKGEWLPGGYVLWGREKTGARWYRIPGETYVV